MASDFDWPWQYKFPPFFTLQRNLDTKSKQIEGWCDLVLSFYKHHKLYQLDVTEAQNSSLFYNKDIDRKLDLDGIHEVLNALQKKGNLEWEGKTKRRCFIMWRTPEEWGSLIFRWAEKSGLTNTVCTLYEIQSGNNSVQEEFHGIDDWMLMKALKTLEQKEKAQVFQGPNQEDTGSIGVKFFS